MNLWLSAALILAAFVIGGYCGIIVTSREMARAIIDRKGKIWDAVRPAVERAK